VAKAVQPSASGASPAPVETRTDKSQASRGAEEAGANPPPTIIEFLSSFDYLVARQPAGVFIAPNTDAPQMYVIEAGTLVETMAKSKDGKWAWVATADGLPAYIALANLGEIEQEASHDPPSPTDVVSGRAAVIDTGRMKIDGQEIALSGIAGLGGSYAKKLQSLIETNGQALECRRDGGQYRCFLPGGIDIGEAALLNCVARPGSGATENYLRQADAAKKARRGVWAQK
jgi:hypothetical protein